MDEEPITTIVERIARERLCFTRRPLERPAHSVWVTEIAGCLRKAYHERTNPLPPTPQAGLARLVGTGVHKLLPLSFENERMVEYRTPDGVLVSGRIDDIVDGFVVEKKTTRRLPEDLGEATLSHVVQAQYYKALLEAMGRPVRGAVLLYIDVAGLDVRALLVPGIEGLLAEIEHRARLLHRALVDSVPPDPEPARGECDYCPYRNDCATREPVGEGEESHG